MSSFSHVLLKKNGRGNVEGLKKKKKKKKKGPYSWTT